ncbi:MAG: hypothetical protein A2Y38_12635 [Spirochaetes bacterium GWB1_59_5]|nr:MAG: hypothetical protein A2Y38_12635 [Spirochaetes bacterium GWB1_59_5]
MSRRVERKAVGKRVTLFVLAMLSSGFTGPAHAGPGGGSQAFIDAGIPTLYAFNEATVSSKNGIAGNARLLGTSIDGIQVKLFETTVGFVESLTLTYYAWPELAAITFEGGDGDGLALEATARLRTTSGGTQFGTGMNLDSDMAALAALEFPFRHSALGTPRRSITLAELNAGGPKQAARLAAAELFLPGRRAAPIILLSLWSVAVVVGAGLWRRTKTGAARGVTGRTDRRTAAELATFVCVVITISVTAFALGAAPAELYAVAVETDTGSRLTDSGASALIRQVTKNGDYRGVAWTVAGEAEARPGGLWFLGIRSPQAAAVPISAFYGFRRLRFKYPPLVIPGPKGSAALAPASFTQAWGLRE